MNIFKRPPGVDVWEPGPKSLDEYTPEEIEVLKKAYKDFKKQFGPVKEFEDFLKKRKI